MVMNEALPRGGWVGEARSDNFLNLFLKIRFPIECNGSQILSRSVELVRPRHFSPCVGEWWFCAILTSYQSIFWKQFHKICHPKDYFITEICTNDDVASITDEANLMSEFNPPYVLRLIGVTFDKEFGLPILVMPFMPNGDLNSYLRRFRYDSDFTDKMILSRVLLNFCLNM